MIGSFYALVALMLLFGTIMLHRYMRVQFVNKDQARSKFLLVFTIVTLLVNAQATFYLGYDKAK